MGLGSGARGTPINFSLNKNKALAAAEYLLIKLGGKYNYMSLLKLIFFTDRYHIRRYVRPVTSDRYVAMHRGPVASYLYNVFHGSIEVPEFRPIDDFGVRLIKQSDRKDELSPSDIEALDFAYAKFSKYDQWDLSDISHIYPEWARYKKRFTKSRRGREEMYLEDFLDDPDPHHPTIRRLNFVDPFEPIPEKEKSEILDEIIEYSVNIIPS